MNGVNTTPKALFLSPNGKIYPDALICSGTISTEFNNKPCYSQNGRLPDPVALDKNDLDYSPDKGKPGVCARPAPNNSLQIWDIGKGTVSKLSLKNCCLCDYSSAGCGYG